MTKNQKQSAEGSGGLPHVMPVWLLVAIWGALIVGTVITVAAAHIDLGSLNLWVAMAIATVKASLVALFFMHLVYDKPFNALILVCSLLFVMLFIGLAMLDTVHYQPELIPGYSPAIGR